MNTFGDEMEFIFSYKDNLIRISGISALKQCIVCELKVSKTKFIIRTLYKSRSQTIEEFGYCKSYFDKSAVNIKSRNSYISLLVDNFNAGNTNWRGKSIKNRNPSFCI